VDPSLYLHRFANKLGVDSKFHAVTNTALRLVASMKRDWMQTGRRPAGICGAALFISAHIHGDADRAAPSTLSPCASLRAALLLPDFDFCSALLLTVCLQPFPVSSSLSWGGDLLWLQCDD
jgi:transcription factor IIIB subunit 2